MITVAEETEKRLLDEGYAPMVARYGAEFLTADHDEPVVRYINVYIVERAYGGPEEGGWWFDEGTPQGVSVVCSSVSIDEMQKLLDLMRKEYPDSNYRFSMRPMGEDYQVRVETHEPREWPTERPHYG